MTELPDIPSEVLSELNSVESEFHEAETRLLKEQVKLFTPLYEKRDPLTRKVPKFWATVFEESDNLAELIGIEDQQLLSHLIELKVRRADEDPRGFTVTMEFDKENEYLQEDSLILTKAFKVRDDSDDGNLSSTPTTINWVEGKDLTKDSSGRPSFFTFFAWTGDDKDVFQEGEEVALVLADQLYPDALKIWTDSQEIDSDIESVDIDSEDEESDDAEEGPATKKQKN